MTKGKTQSATKVREICPDCGWDEPWHIIHCVKVKNKYCIDCRAMLPRHYPSCSQDTIKFRRWWIPEYQQRGVVEAYLLMLDEAKFKGEYQEPPKMKPPVRYVFEHNVNPIDGQRIMKAIFTMLESGSHPEMIATKTAILAEINAIAKKQLGEKGEE